MENLNLGRLGRLEVPNHSILPVTIKDDGSIVVLPSGTVARPLEKQRLSVHLNSIRPRRPVSAGIVLRDCQKYMPQTLSAQTALGVIRRSEISKLRNKGVVVQVVGKVSTVLHDSRLQQIITAAYNKIIKPATYKKTAWQVNHAKSSRSISVCLEGAVFSAKGMGDDLYFVQYIKSEQDSIERAEHELAERKKRLNRFVKEHQNATKSDSSEKKTSQPCCRFHRCVNEKELALSLKDIYEMYFKSPVRKKLLSNYDSVSDFTAMLYIILVGCGVVINKQATPFCEFINLQVWTLDATSRTMRNHLNQLLGDSQDAETFKIEGIRNERLKQDFQNLKRCFQKSSFYKGISELLDNKE